MNKCIKTLITELENTLKGEPWYGRSVYEILDEVNKKQVFIKPAGQEHSQIELLYHMYNWAFFTANRIAGKKDSDPATAHIDWTPIDPTVHSWSKGLKQFKAAHTDIIKLLSKKEDSFLEEKVDYRDYDFQFLINGLMQHNIYHLGQVAYISKLLAHTPAK